MSWREEYWRSIKSFDTEEKLDLYFYRPIGFAVAKLAKALRLTPDHLTYAGALSGIAAGPFFAHPENSAALIAGSFLLIWAGILDSSDGQLARMGGGKGSKFGLVLDGICDNVVFTAIYIGSVYALMQKFGVGIWLVAVPAGFLHSLQSSGLDYYNRDYLYFGYGKVDGDYWNLSNAEAAREAGQANGFEAFLLSSRLSWIWQQNKLSTRSQATRESWRNLVTGPRSPEFQDLYRDHNRVMLRWWRLMGPNFHTIMILVFTFLRRFDLYLLCVDITCLTIALFVLRMFQARVDARFLAALRARGLG